MIFDINLCQSPQYFVIYTFTVQFIFYHTNRENINRLNYDTHKSSNITVTESARKTFEQCHPPLHLKSLTVNQTSQVLTWHLRDLECRKTEKKKDKTNIF